MKVVPVLSAVALGIASSAVPAQTKWDLPAAYPASNFHTENLMQFVADVDKATGGKLKITVHANASLFKAPEIKRAVQTNQAQIGEILISNFSNENPLYGIDVLPFLATSYDAARKLDRAARPALDKLLAAQGMKLLYTVAWPPQGLYSTKPLQSASDLKGMKFRSYNAATAKIAEMFGAQPVTIQAAELSQAMASGGVEAFITSGSTGYDTKAYEHIKYFYDTQAWLPKNAVIVNQSAFDKLDKPVQEALLKAAADAETRGWKSSEEKTAWYLDQLKKNGMQVLPPTPKMTSEFEKVGDALVADWVKQAGPDGKAILDAYRKM
ncbi:MAG: TRAP transporter substrate-binding protein [Burkholderiaceae bacterium]|nr:TRAP transporter substrate-binding protein [Burkholderiaceae bacterium]MCD6672991.1 TRAP transporter substrate-binding protein [Burkholderiaceae bacterium]